MDSGLVNLSNESAGRRLVSEKILFNQRTVVAGDDADWGRDVVKEQQIVSVRGREREEGRERDGGKDEGREKEGGGGMGEGSREREREREMYMLVCKIRINILVACGSH